MKQIPVYSIDSMLTKEHRILFKGLDRPKFTTVNEQVHKEKKDVASATRRKLQLMGNAVDENVVALKDEMKEGEREITEEEKKVVIQKLQTAIDALGSTSFKERNQATKNIVSIVKEYKSTSIRKEVLDECWSTAEDNLVLLERKTRLWSVLNNFDSRISRYSHYFAEGGYRNPKVVSLVKKLSYVPESDFEEFFKTFLGSSEIADNVKMRFLEDQKGRLLPHETLVEIFSNPNPSISEEVKSRIVKFCVLPEETVKFLLFASDKQVSERIKRYVFTFQKIPDELVTEVLLDESGKFSDALRERMLSKRIVSHELLTKVLLAPRTKVSDSLKKKILIMNNNNNFDFNKKHVVFEVALLASAEQVSYKEKDYIIESCHVDSLVLGKGLLAPNSACLQRQKRYILTKKWHYLPESIMKEALKSKNVDASLHPLIEDKIDPKAPKLAEMILLSTDIPDKEKIGVILKEKLPYPFLERIYFSPECTDFVKEALIHFQEPLPESISKDLQSKKKEE